MRRLVLLTGLAAGIATPAFAHVGLNATSGFAAGFQHPFSGLDHMLAMIALGIWAGLASPARPWIWPATFLTFMLGGFLAGAAGLQVAGAEALIVGSVIAFGLVIAAGWKAPTLAGCAVTGLLALAHGYAHGAESPANASGLTFAIGFLIATSLLHVAGLALSQVARLPGSTPMTRATGLGVACAGVALAWGG